MTEEQKPEPLVYPIVSLILRTTQMVNGKSIYSEAEEILDFKKLAEATAMTKAIGRFINDFRTYLKRLRDTVNSPEGAAALAKTLAEHEQKSLSGTALSGADQ